MSDPKRAKERDGRHGRSDSGAQGHRVDTPGGLAAFIGLVALAAVAACVLLPRTGLDTETPALITLAGLALFVGTRSIKVPALRIEVTATDAFAFCGLLVVGPLGAPLVALAGVVGALVIRAGRQPVSRVVFNAAAVTLSAAAAAWAHRAVRSSEALETYAEPAAALLAAVAFGVANVTLVGIAMSLGKRSSFLAAWRNFGIWAVGSSIGSLLIAVGLATLTASLGIAGLVIGLLGTNLVAASIRAFRDRTPTLDPAASH